MTDDLTAATDRALLDALAQRLRDAGSEGEAAKVARWVAGRIVGELCRRHGIVPDGFVTVTESP